MSRGFKIPSEWKAWVREDPNRMLYLEPGFAGELNRKELAFIKAVMKVSPELRRRWGFVARTGKLNDDDIRAVAMGGEIDYF